MTARASPLKGLPVSEGIGLGVVFLWSDDQDNDSVVRQLAPDALDAEWTKLVEAIAKAAYELRQIEQLVASRIGQAVSDVFHAQSLILEDPSFVSELRSILFEKSCDASSAVRLLLARWQQRFEGIDVPHLKERWSEVREIGQLVLAALTDERERSSTAIPPDAVIVTKQLGAAACARLPLERVKGIVTELGGRTSHAFILARAGGIPSVTGVANAVGLLRSGDTVIVDGVSGLVIPNPDASTRREYLQSVELLATATCNVPQKNSGEKTRSPSPFEIMASIAKSADAASALQLGADGIGLFRTEFAYMIRPAPPREAEIAEVAAFVEEQCPRKPPIFRLLDLGGEKTPPYLSSLIRPTGPLGLRGLRLLLAHRELMETQLRGLFAGLRGTEIKILFPMVTSVGDFRIARGIAEAVWRSVAKSFGERDRILRVGAMIETPSAVWIADDLAKEADFFNVGLSDLTQYTLVADRDDPGMQAYLDPSHPAIDSSLRHVIRVARSNNVPVTACAEASMAPNLFHFLAEVGFRSFSVGLASIARARDELSSVRLKSEGDRSQEPGVEHSGENEGRQM